MTHFLSVFALEAISLVITVWSCFPVWIGLCIVVMATVGAITLFVLIAITRLLTARAATGLLAAARLNFGGPWRALSDAGGSRWLWKSPGTRILGAWRAKESKTDPSPSTTERSSDGWRD